MVRLRDVILGRPRRGRYTLARRALQLAILLLFSLQAVLGYRILMGSLASSKILRIIPLMDPFAWIEHSVATLSPTLESITAVLVVVALYSILGRFFCGWVCPMDLLFSIFERKLALAKHPPHARPRLPSRLDKTIPVAMMIAYIVLTVIIGQPFFTTISPIAGTTKLGEFVVGVVYRIPGAALASVISWSIFTLAALLVNIVGEYVFGVKRLWCKYICPVGNLYGLVMNKYSPLSIRIAKPSECVYCNLCSMVCPMNIDIVAYIKRGERVLRDHRCFHCGRCVEVCPRHVLTLGFRSGGQDGVLHVHGGGASKA